MNVCAFGVHHLLYCGENMNDKPTIVPTIKTNDEVLSSLEKLRRSEASCIETARIVARIRRASYLAYLEQGFSEQQALELCSK